MASAWLWTIALNGTLGLAGYGLARYGFRQPPGLPRVLAAVVLAWAWATLGLEVLGSFGLLARLPLLLWSGVGLATAAGLRWKYGPGDTAAPAPSSPAWDTEAVFVLGLALWAAALFGGPGLLYPLKVVSDGPIYHLYFAARWWKAERLFLIATPFGETAAPYFPAVGDLWFTWLMVGWGGERLAKIGQAPFLLAAATAAYALSRRLGAGRSAALLATVWFATLTPLFLFAFEPNVDTIFAAGYMLAAYFFVRDGLGDDRGPSLALGALASGCALGTKAIGVVFVPPLLALATVGLLTRRGWGSRQKVAGLLALALLPLATAGYWFGKNLLLTGNPLYPLRLAVFGHTLLAGWYGPGAMRRSIYYAPFANWRVLIDQLLAVVDPRTAGPWAAALAGAWAWGRRQAAPQARWIWACAGLAVLDIGLFWFLIPYRTQQRFMYPALGLSVVPLAALIDRSRWLRSAAALLLTLHLLTPQGWPFAAEGTEVPWDFTPAIPNSMSSLIVVPHNLAQFEALRTQKGYQWDATRSSLLIGLTAVVIAGFWGRAARAPRSAARVAWAGIATAAAVGGLLAALAPPRSDPRLEFYANFPEYHRGWLQLDARSGPGGARVAYAGTDLPFYLLGAGLRNEVRYINVDAHPDWLMHNYHRALGFPTWPDPRPGWDRLHPDYEAWLANLRAEGIQLLVVTRANRAEGAYNLADPEGFPIERQWAEAHPETFELLYGRAERDRNFRLYRVRPPAR